GQLVTGEAAAEAGVVAFAIIGPIARIVTEIDVVLSRGHARGGSVVIAACGTQGYLTGFECRLAIGCVAHLVDRAAHQSGAGAFETRVVALLVIGERTRIVAEIDILGERGSAER